MNEIEENNLKSKTKMWHACVSFVMLIAVMLVGIVYFGADPHIPMFIGVVIAAIMSLIIGYKWNNLEQMMIDGISKSMQAILILIVVGMLIGIWILSGTIPSMIYYGLMILKPEIFLIAAMLVCTITSLATGTSWGTMGTMGLAIMGIGVALNIPIGPTAGAIISGAYFGDKMSPLSGSTNLAAAMAGTDVFTNIKYMIRPTLVAYVLTCIFFGVYGLMYIPESTTSAGVSELMDALASSFNINPILLLPPVVVVFAIIFKIPALPGITLGAFAGAILALIFQSDLTIFDANGEILNVGVNFGNILLNAKDGFFYVSDNELLSSLLTTGGIMNMSSSILMTVIAMMFGGIMEGTGQLDVLITSLLKHVKTNVGLIGVTEITCIFSNIVMPEQYISVLIPGRMYASAYRKRGLHPKCLSNALESAGTVTSPLVPWNTCALFINSTIGVKPFGADGYFIWSVFNLLVPIINFIMAIFKITVTKMTPEEQKKADKGELV